MDGADNIDEAIKLRSEMQEHGGFGLKKWKSSELAVLAQLPCELVDSQSTQSIGIDHYTKGLGVEWNATADTFRPVVTLLKQVEMLTKRPLPLKKDVTLLSESRSSAVKRYIALERSLRVRS